MTWQTAPYLKHAVYAGILGSAAAAFGIAGLWPISCVLCVEIGFQWCRAWGFAQREERKP
jgi:hypothetical protein